MKAGLCLGHCIPESWHSAWCGSQEVVDSEINEISLSAAVVAAV